jgi:hypothetical protein
LVAPNALNGFALLRAIECEIQASEMADHNKRYAHHIVRPLSRLKLSKRGNVSTDINNMEASIETEIPDLSH